MELKSSNPAFKNLSKNITWNSSEAMSINGTINKSLILLLTIIVAASITWRSFLVAENFGLAKTLMIVGAIVGLIASLVTIFKKEIAKFSAPIYAIGEGLFLGGVSSIFEAAYPGLVLKAVMLTFAVFAIVLFAYRSGVIKPTQKFMLGIVAATGAIALIYIVDIILGFFGINMPMIHSNGTFGIIFSLAVVAIAALNLIIDFKNIEDAAEMRLPAYMEWYLAFGLMVTLVWLYIEILRLLSKIQSRD